MDITTRILSWVFDRPWYLFIQWLLEEASKVLGATQIICLRDDPESGYIVIGSNNTAWQDGDIFELPSDPDVEAPWLSKEDLPSEWDLGFCFEVADGGLRIVLMGGRIDSYPLELLVPVYEWLSQTYQARSRIGFLETSLEEAERRAKTDPLTNLANIRGLQEVLKEMVPGWCIAMLDVDHFKRYNDTYGHIAGDMALKVLGDLLAELDEENPEIALVARYGGEEFTIVFDETTLNRAVEVTNSLRKRLLEIDLGIDNQPRSITISGGVYQAKLNDSSHKAIEEADGQLYVAKKQRNCVAW